MTQYNADNHATRLTSRRFIGQFLAYPLWLFCEITARILRSKELSPRENTKRAYEVFLDPYFAKTGVWEDYTEGYYENGDETYLEAQLKQFDFILTQSRCDEGTKVFDMGCGNGRLLQRAQERGCIPSGITLAESQAEACQEKNLNVVCGSFLDIKENFAPHQFDVVIINGSSEHFVTELDKLHNNAESVRRQIVDLAKYLLKPGGRLFISCIHFRFDTDIKKALQHPLRHRAGSFYFYISTLVHMYSGWYPYQDEYIDIAQQLGFNHTLARNATYDYYLTSLHWDERFIKFRRKNRWYTVKFVLRTFLNDPRYFLIATLYAGYGVWTWQFRDAEARGDGRRSPMIARWLGFELTKID